MISRSSVALGNLRAIVIIIVLAFHSVLPYLATNPAEPHRFGATPPHWLAFPIIDPQRWFGFDLFCAWQDVSLMSLMFFLAGLLAAPSLQRKGGARYLSDRFWRIGVPFVLAIIVLSPLAYYAAHRATATDPSLAAFWSIWLALPFWPSGPQWFLWQLFAVSAMAALLFAFVPAALGTLGSLAARLQSKPVHFFIGLSAASAVVYVPLAVAYSPWAWDQLGPFSLQLSRPLHYIVYFFAAFAIGSHGWDRGLLHCEGPVARHWLAWLATALVTFGVWGGLTSLTMPDWHASPLFLRAAASFAFAPACAAGCLALLALCLRWMRTQHALLDSLSSHAYVIYLIHYVPVLWLQYALLGSGLPAIVKAAVVFVAAIGLSWSASVGFFRIFAHAQVSTPGRGMRAMVTDQRG
jgi:glucans biosynthesis protein C